MHVHTLLFNCCLIIPETVGGSFSVKAKLQFTYVYHYIICIKNYQSSESYTLYHLHRLRTPHQEIVDWSQRVLCNLVK